MTTTADRIRGALEHYSTQAAELGEDGQELTALTVLRWHGQILLTVSRAIDELEAAKIEGAEADDEAEAEIDAIAGVLAAGAAFQIALTSAGLELPADVREAHTVWLASMAGLASTFPGLLEEIEGVPDQADADQADEAPEPIEAAS